MLIDELDRMLEWDLAISWWMWRGWSGDLGEQVSEYPVALFSAVMGPFPS